MIEIEVYYRSKKLKTVDQLFLEIDNDMTELGNIMKKEIKLALKQYLEAVYYDLRTKHSKGMTTPRSLHIRSNIMSRIGTSVQGGGKTSVRGVISLPPRLTIHEFGGWIKAKKGKYLTIPIDYALKSGGRRKLNSIRMWHHTFIVHTKSGELIVAQKNKRAALFKPLYVLKERVYIPPRLGLRKIMEENMPYLGELMQDHVYVKMKNRFK